MGAPAASRGTAAATDLRIGVVTVVAGREAHLRNHLAGVMASSTAPGVHVVVAMGDDAVAATVHAGTAGAPYPTVVVPLEVTDEGLPLATARNLGALTAIEAGAQLLVFLDVDCIPDRGLLDGYRAAALDRPDALLCGAVTYLPPAPDGGYDLNRLSELRAPHPARPALPAGQRQSTDHYHLFWSLSFAATVEVWRTVGGFCERYRGYGGEDTDFAMVARQEEVPLVWAGGADAYHQHHAVSAPPIEHLDDLLRNGAIFHERWGAWPMAGWFEELARMGLVESDGLGGWQRA